MPPVVAVAVWFICLVLLLRFDPARDPRASVALWVPLIWMFFVASRDPSQWIAGGTIQLNAQVLEQGNPLDRTIFSLLLLLSIAILASRSFPWARFLRQNWALTLLVAFELISATWSDFPFVAAKRWIRDLDNYLVVLVILSDPRPLQAAKTVLRRLSYLLVPLSILLIKYFSVMGRQYDAWSGMTSYVGAATSKNMLGAICLVSGIFFFWDTVTRWPERRQRRTRKILLVNVAFLALTLWVMHLADSTTSDVCLALGCVIVTAAHMKWFRRHAGFLKALPPLIFGMYLLFLALGLQGQLAASLGKDPTLTDRTKIWAFLLTMHTNPLIGTGYQTFWLGPRLEWFWTMSHLGHLNEAHNGYLEIYLEIGLIGAGLLAIFLISSYRQICRRLASDSGLAIFGMAAWMMIVFYNMSEAAFEGGLLFMILLLGTIVAPVQLRRKALRPAAAPVPQAAAVETAKVSEHVLDYSS